MKRIIFSAYLFLILLSTDSYSQTYNWITPNKNYLKLSVVEDAVYRITRTDFTNAGITTSSIDPRTIKVYNKGAEIPIYFQGDSDGVFDATDYLDFYGKRNYGGLTKYYNVDNVVMYTKDEYYNNYSDTNVYWIGWDGSNGTRFTDLNNTSTELYGSDISIDKIHFEKDKVYSQGERADGNDFRYFNNELFLGEGWYWSNMYTNVNIADTFSLPLLSPVTQNAYVKIFAYPSDINTGVTNEHNLVIKINGLVVGNIFKNDFGRFDTTIAFSTSMFNTSTYNTVGCQYFATGYDGHVNFDFMQIQYPKIFKFRNNQFSAELNTDTTSKQFRVTGFVPANQLKIYDVKNGYIVNNYTYSGDTLIFTGKSNAKFEIINKTNTKKPFRISVRQVPDLASASNGADYLLIYHSLFTSQAEQLRNHRQTHDNFRSVKAEIRDVYDIFNYGIEDPAAIRNFGRYVYNYWQAPKFKYMCLMGRGTIDPKKNSTTTIYGNNYIPVVGNPTTDNYFGNFNGGGFSFNLNVGVGRLTAITAAEAQIMVDNIISYETQSPASWWKNHIYIVGGGTQSDQTFFQSLITPFINNYVIPPPLSGDPHKIFRTDYTSQVTYNYKDSIRRDINNGAAIVNFQGHAGNQDWEDGMQDPTTLANYGKLPFILSMTCYTGKTADPTARIFGERYMNMSNRGAVGFLGSTGWGFAYSGNSLQNWMLYGLAHDTLRRVGDILKFGMSKLLYDSSSSSVRHTINCYGLIGDPAVKLVIPVLPEFNITSTDYRLSNNFPAVNENVYLTLYPKNFGLYADSCKIRFDLKKNNVSVLVRDTVLKAFKFKDSVYFSFKLDSLQNYTVTATLDQDNWYPAELKTNNSININIPLKNISFLTVKPVENSVIKTDSVEFLGINPVSKIPSANIKVLLEFDTTKSFNSPLKRTFVKNNVSGVYTKFKSDIPLLNNTVLYYWRTNAVINSDSSGWTTAKSLSYNTNVLFNTEDKDTPEPLQTSADSNNITVHKFKSSQFGQYDMYYTNSGANGISLNTNTLNLSVRSMGSSGAEISNFSVNDKAVNIDGGRSPGLNMLKVRKINGHIIEQKNFRMRSTQASDSVINFLNTFDSTYYLMALNASYVDYFTVVPMTTACKNKIKSFGSTKIDSVAKFGWFDTWSFIGSLGATGSDVSEQFYLYTVSTGWRESNSYLTRTYYDTYGTVSNVIGPSQGWKDFRWQNTLVPNSTVLFDVIGIDRNGGQTLLMSDQNNNTGVSLSSINSYQYPYLNLLTKISIDTNTGKSSSFLNTVTVNYTAPSELAPDISSLKLSDTSVFTGSDLKFGFNIYNLGYTSFPGVVVNIYKVSPSAVNLIRSDTVTKSFKPDSINNFYTKFKVPYYRTGADGKLPVYVDLLLKGENNEFYSYNNPVNFSVTLKNPRTDSRIELISDGSPVKSGDVLRSTPEMKINITGEFADTKLISDTSGLVLKLNDIYVPFFTNGKANAQLKPAEIQSSDGNSGIVKSYNFYPVFKNGTNKLTLIYKYDTDETDTAYYDFTASDLLTIKELYNFPNPMKDHTDFVFNLSGNFNSAGSKIKIYTAAGRLIREINFTGILGYNQISWDGRDSDGDNVANGTYLYKIVTEDDSGKESSVQKLVVLR